MVTVPAAELTAYVAADNVSVPEVALAPELEPPELEPLELEAPELPDDVVLVAELM
jgi:hypothetical protein